MQFPLVGFHDFNVVAWIDEARRGIGLAGRGVVPFMKEQPMTASRYRRVVLKLSGEAFAEHSTGYGIDSGRGIAFGIGLQAIEVSVGLSLGLLFLAREGLSIAAPNPFLRRPH